MSVERRGQAIGVETGPTGDRRSPRFYEGRQLFIDGTSRMNREVQVRICEGLGVKFPGPTRQKRRFDRLALTSVCSSVSGRRQLER